MKMCKHSVRRNKRFIPRKIPIKLYQKYLKNAIYAIFTKIILQFKWKHKFINISSKFGIKTVFEFEFKHRCYKLGFIT